MPRLRRSALLLTVAAGFAAGPVTSQDAPRSILPEGFEAPAAPPPQVDTTPLIAPAAPPAEVTTEAAPPTEDAAPTGAAIDVAGPLTEARGGYGVAAFEGADGRFVAGLLRRLDAPLASRWAHIVLRRALLSESRTPANIGAADWIATRAATLLRFGEVDSAVLLVDAVAPDRYSPLLYRTAGQVHLAAADLGGLCPLAETGIAVSGDPVWRLLTGMCGAMTGDDLTSAAIFDQLRSGNAVDPFDLQLAERIATLSGGGGRAANIDWNTAPPLTPYRFGVALASGVRIPDERMAHLNAGWVLRAPGSSETARLAALRPAAAYGIASAQELVSTVSAATAGLEGDALAASPGANLRAAFAAASTRDRYTALAAIRDGGSDSRGRYAALIETALPAARMPVDKAHADDAPALIAAMLSAGMEAPAQRWWPAIDGSDGGVRAWGLLASSGTVPVTPERFEAWADTSTPHRAALLLAGLDALGLTRGDWASARKDAGLVPVSNSWTQAIGRAAAAGRAGEVAVLAATGLQCSWHAVPPEQLRAIVAAYMQVGRAHEARMIIAEAVTRG